MRRRSFVRALAPLAAALPFVGPAVADALSRRRSGRVVDVPSLDLSVDRPGTLTGLTVRDETTGATLGRIDLDRPPRDGTTYLGEGEG